MYEGFQLSPCAASAPRFAFLPHAAGWADAEHGRDSSSLYGYLAVNVKGARLEKEVDSFCRLRLEDATSGRNVFPDLSTAVVKQSANPI